MNLKNLNKRRTDGRSSVPASLTSRRRPTKQVRDATQNVTDEYADRLYRAMGDFHMEILKATDKVLVNTGNGGDDFRFVAKAPKKGNSVEVTKGDWYLCSDDVGVEAYPLSGDLKEDLEVILNWSPEYFDFADFTEEEISWIDKEEFSQYFDEENY